MPSSGSHAGELVHQRSISHAAPPVIGQVETDGAMLAASQEKFPESWTLMNEANKASASEQKNPRLHQRVKEGAPRNKESSH